MDDGTQVRVTVTEMLPRSRSIVVKPCVRSALRLQQPTIQLQFNTFAGLHYLQHVELLRFKVHTNSTKVCRNFLMNLYRFVLDLVYITLVRYLFAL